RDSGVADEQRTAVERFREGEADIYVRARAAIYKFYRETSILLDEMLMTAAPLLEMVPMQIRIPRARLAALEEARKAAKSPEELDEILHTEIEAALRDQFRRGDRKKSTWASMIPKMRSMRPKIEKGNELDGLASFESILVGGPKSDVSRIGIVLKCPWDEEH